MTQRKIALSIEEAADYILTSSFFLTQSFKFNNQTGNYPNLLTLFGVPDFFPA